MSKAPSHRKRLTSTASLTAGELASALDGISEQTVYRWARAGCPHERRGGKLYFDLKSARDWHTARRGNVEPGAMGRPAAVDSAPPDLKEATAVATLRKITAQAEKIEHSLAVTRGQFFSAEEVQKGRLARIAAVKAGLLALPARLGARCAERSALEVEQAARDEVERLLAEFAGGAGSA